MREETDTLSASQEVMRKDTAIFHMHFICQAVLNNLCACVFMAALRSPDSVVEGK